MKRLLKGIAVVCLTAIAMAASAQDSTTKENSKIRFANYTAAGVLMGQNNPHLGLQTINGVQWQQWFAGAGVGLDYYYMRSVPVFIDLRRTVLPRKNFYLYADAGVNFPYLKKGDNEDTWYTSTYKEGLYLDGGVGYLFSASRQTGFFSIGYSTKKLNETIEHPYIWGPPNMPVRKDNLQYQFNRIVIKAGLRF